MRAFKDGCVGRWRPGVGVGGLSSDLGARGHHNAELAVIQKELHIHPCSICHLFWQLLGPGRGVFCASFLSCP